MDNLNLKRVPVAKTGILIRRPVAEVFEALIDPGRGPLAWLAKSNEVSIQPFRILIYFELDSIPTGLYGEIIDESDYN